jgi:hypothetical protein
MFELWRFVMKAGHFQRLVAAVAAALLIFLAAAPVSATEFETNPAEDATSPVVFDLLILRPIGIVGAAVSAVLFIAPVAPLTLITRPSDISRPFEKMIINPARYVVVDKLGEH